VKRAISISAVGRTLAAMFRSFSCHALTGLGSCGNWRRMIASFG